MPAGIAAAGSEKRQRLLQPIEAVCLLGRYRPTVRRSGRETKRVTELKGVAGIKEAMGKKATAGRRVEVTLY